MTERLNLVRQQYAFFGSVLREIVLSPSTQLVYLHLVWEANRHWWTEEFELTDEELMKRTNIQSKSTIAAAKRVLKNHKLIDFTTGKQRPTKYTVLRLYSCGVRTDRDDSQFSVTETELKKEKLEKERKACGDGKRYKYDAEGRLVDLRTGERLDIPRAGFLSNNAAASEFLQQEVQCDESDEGECADDY